MAEQKKILIYGYGNPGRQDDGLGKAMVDMAESWTEEAGIGNVTFDTNYQLQVEDVTLMKDKDLVIFVDASMKEHSQGYHFEEVTADSGITFTMHAVSPGFILALYRKMYGEPPPSYLLHIKGYQWDLSEDISKPARNNLNNAWKALKQVIMDNGSIPVLSESSIQR